MKRRIEKQFSEETLSIVTNTHQMVNGNLEIQMDTSQYSILSELAVDINQIGLSINEYIKEIAHVLSHLSAGNMAVSFSKEVKYQGDFLPIKNALHKIRKSLNNSFEEINQLSLEIDTMCSRVEADSSMIAKNATTQAELICDLSTTMNEITEQTIHTAESAKEASIKMENIREETKTGREYINLMLTSMQNVQNSSNDISRITDMLSAIASQTKLLALNASIEAARAGEAGAGFSIVAKEVGQLAEKSVDAVKNTTVLVTNNIKTAKESMSIVDKTAESFRTIEKSIDGITKLNKVIAGLSETQAESLQSTSNIISNISAMVQSNAVYAQENCTEASSLNNVSNHLKDVLGRYRLKNQASKNPIDMAEENKMIEVLITKLTSKLNRVGNISAIDLILEDEIEQQKDLECLYVIGNDGKQISHTIMNPDILIEQDENFKPAMPGEDYSQKKYFRKAISNHGVPYTSVEYISTATGGLCKTISCSFEDVDHHVSIICIDMICRF